MPEWLTGRPAKALLYERQSSNLCVVDWGSSSGVERLLCTQKVGSSILSFSRGLPYLSWLERSAVNREVGGSSPPGRVVVRMPEWSKGSRLGRDTKVRGFKPHSAQSSVV